MIRSSQNPGRWMPEILSSIRTIAEMSSSSSGRIRTAVEVSGIDDSGSGEVSAFRRTKLAAFAARRRRAGAAFSRRERRVAGDRRERDERLQRTSGLRSGAVLAGRPGANGVLRAQHLEHHHRDVVAGLGLAEEVAEPG